MEITKWKEWINIFNKTYFEYTEKHVLERNWNETKTVRFEIWSEKQLICKQKILSKI